jgi:hypothetical protein
LLCRSDSEVQGWVALANHFTAVIAATRGANQAPDKLSLSLLHARLIDLKLPIKIVEGE